MEPLLSVKTMKTTKVEINLSSFNLRTCYTKMTYTVRKLKSKSSQVPSLL